MSYAAIITAVVGAGTAAYGAYSSSQQQKNAVQSYPDYQPIDYSSVIDYLQGNYTVPSLINYTGTPYDTGYQQYLQAGNKYGGQLSNFLERTNDRSNAQYRTDLFKTSPTLHRNIAQQGVNTAQFLRGQIPTDVQALVKNNAAETSLLGGYGGSQMSRNLTARDLGITSLDLIERGNRGLAQQFGLSQSLNPYQSDTLSLLMSPGQLQANQTNENRYINQSANQNAITTAGFKNNLSSAIADLMAQQEAQNATGINTNNIINWQRGTAPDPWMSALSSGLGGLSSSIDWGSLLGGGRTGPSSYGPSNYGYSPDYSSLLSRFGNDDISNYL